MVHAACVNCGPKSQHRATRIALAPTPYSMLPWRPPAHLVPTGDSGPQLAQAIAEEDLSQDLMDLVPTVTGAPFSIDDGPLGREGPGDAGLSFRAIPPLRCAPCERGAPQSAECDCSAGGSRP